jgi:hypothetical protein
MADTTVFDGACANCGKPESAHVRQATDAATAVNASCPVVTPPAPPA